MGIGLKYPKGIFDFDNLESAQGRQKSDQHSQKTVQIAEAAELHWRDVLCNSDCVSKL